MTVQETVEIIGTSSLWKILSIKETIEALTYAMETAGIKVEDEDIVDIIGEVYAG